MSYRSKHSKANSSKGQQNDKTFQISRNRFISVSEFKGQMRVDVREFYTDNEGEQRPGRKGISLSMVEWNKLKEFIPKIEKAIKGIDDSSDSDSDDRHKKSNKKSKSDSDDGSDSDSDERQKKTKKLKKSSSESDSDSNPKNKKAKKSTISDSDSD